MAAQRRIRTAACRIAALLGLSCLIASAALARPVTDTSRLRALSANARAKISAQQTSLYHELLSSTDPAAVALNHAPGLELMFIGTHGVPVYYLTTNLNAAKTVRTWDVWPSGVGGGFYGVTGSTTAPGELALWDEARVKGTHVEFGGRVTQMDAPTKLSQHATHVAGTLIAAGVNPNARGMSYQAPLHTYDWKNDVAEMAAAAAGNLEISNHSYGIVTGWQSNYWFGDLTVSATEDYGFGFYDEGAAEFDSVAYLAPEYLIVIGAGNDRNNGWAGTHFHWDGHAWVSADDYHAPDYRKGGYDTVSWFGTAKNALLVGAVDDIPGGYTDPSSVVMMPFSSWGPCDDGRIKPDIVANGYALLSTDTVGVNSYFSSTGTSMSSPNAAGSINLIAHEFTAQFGHRPLSSTLKAIVINSADEAGTSQGPDYGFGWGLLDTHRAIDLVRNPAPDHGIVERTLGDGETQTYPFTCDGTQPVRVTIAWTDPPGTPPPPSVDPPDKMLVNDLDVRLTSVAGGVTTFPWTLDSLNPSAAAAQGDNSTDNVESIDLAVPPADNYVVTVTHKGSLSSGAQAYALVWRGLQPNTSTGVGPGTTPMLSLGLPVPHPVRTRAIIGYRLDGSTTVSIRVYDVRGRKVATLLESGTRRVGTGSVELDASSLASGVYFVRMQTPLRTVTRKITIVK